MRAALQILQAQAHPPELLPSLRAVKFVCPLCRGNLGILANGYGCDVCRKEYLLHAGIPDFRVFPDPYLDFREDYERAEIVLAGLEKYDLEKLLEYYWSFSDITPEHLRPKFVRSALMGEERAKRALEILENAALNENAATKRVLEIGSGTGNFLALAARKYELAIGVDIAMRWLHISRRRFLDKNLPVPPLVCCCAEFLPFADDSFDIVAMSSTLEFVKDQPQVLSETARVLKPGGSSYVNSVNRYALARDPYAYLWGVGFVPRRWQQRYVRWRNGATYKTKTLSYAEFDNLAKKDFIAREFALPEVSEAALKHFSGLTRAQIKTYRLIKKLPFPSGLLRRIGPGWDVILRKSDFRG